MMAGVDSMNISTALELWGTGAGFVGASVTGFGLFVAWRRNLERMSAELRAIVGGAQLAVTVHMTAEGEVSSPATGSLNIDPDGPVPDQLTTLQENIRSATRSFQAEIQRVNNQVHELRTAITGRTTVTDSDVDTRVRALLAERERREGKIALQDLRIALIGIAITAAGIMITGLGLIAAV
jgi:hypothetical protein